MRRLAVLLAVAGLALLFAQAASASSLPLSSVPSHNVQPVCPGGWLVSAQDGDATPPAVPPTCGLSTMTGSSWLDGDFAAAPGYGTVVVSVYLATVDRATSLSLIVDGSQVGASITPTAGTKQWWSFPAVQVGPSDTVEVALTFGAGSMSTVSSMHAEYTANTLSALLYADQTLPHEQLPEGVPCSYDWSGCEAPVSQHPGPVVHDATDVDGYQYANPWGQVYNAASGNPAPLDRVQIENLNEWYLSKSTGEWVALYSSPPTLGGAMFPEAFNGPSICGRYAFDGSGGILVSPNVACGGVQETGYLWHFYPAQSRAYIANPSDIAAIAVQAEVRLDPENPTSPAPDYVANVGADFWGCSACGTNSGSGEGRFITVGPNWQLLTYDTVPAGQIASTGLPPIADDPAEWFVQ